MIAGNIFKGLKEKSNQKTVKVFELIQFQKRKKRKVEKKKNGESVKMGTFSKMRSVDLWNLSHHKNVIRATGVNRVVTNKLKRKKTKFYRVGKNKKNHKKFKLKKKKVQKFDTFSLASSVVSKMSFRSDFKLANSNELTKSNTKDLHLGEDYSSHFEDSGIRLNKNGGNIFKQGTEDSIEVSDVNHDNLNEKNFDEDLQKFFRMDKLGIEPFHEDDLNNPYFNRIKKPKKFQLMFVQAIDQVKPKFDLKKRNLRFDGLKKKMKLSQFSRSESKKRKRRRFSVSMVFRNPTKKEKYNEKLKHILDDIDKTRTIYDKINKEVQRTFRFNFGKEMKKKKRRKLKHLQKMHEEQQLRVNGSF